jgi:hypothetical protein
MKLLPLTLFLVALCYAGLLVLCDAALEASQTGSSLIGQLWRLSGGLALLGTALELTLLLVWLGLRAAGRGASDVVPLRLSSAAWAELDGNKPSLALLMPAHGEASSPEDARALADRLFNLLLLSPCWSHLYVLFDSPARQRPAELGVIAAVQRRLCEAGLWKYASRLRVEEYRDKPKELRNKPGSLVQWLGEHAHQYNFAFILDADSELVEDKARPETCDVIARMLFAMVHDRDAGLGMIQAALQIGSYRTLWGWYQAVNALWAFRYHGPLWQVLLGDESPSYGHNQLWRVEALRRACNTLEYLSHDHIDSADCAAAGFRCVQSHHVVTMEGTEESLHGYLNRELRWCRGNAQFANYLSAKGGLPLGAWFYLLRGIHHYFSPLFALVYLLCTAALIHDGVSIVPAAGARAPSILSGLVVLALLGPKLAARPRPLDLVGGVLIGLLMAPALMLYQGLLFLLGPLSRKWTLRGTRSIAWTDEHFSGILRLFYPVALFGLLLGLLIRGKSGVSPVEFMVALMVACLVLSPVAAAILSRPWQ